jgi:hypothetical protein
MFLIYQHWGYGMSVHGVVDSVERGRELTDSIVNSFILSGNTEFKEILNPNSNELTIRYLQTYTPSYGKNKIDKTNNIDFYLRKINLNEEIVDIEAEG